MKLPSLSALLLGLSAALAPAGADAQARADECSVTAFERVDRQELNGYITTYVVKPVVDCQSGTRLRADEATIFALSNEVHLSGNVFFEDPEKRLTSQTAMYSSVSGRLFAQGDVVFVDRAEGSTLRGPQLEYFRPMEGRPEPQMIAPGRPHLTVQPRSRPGEDDAGRGRPIEIDADRIVSLARDQMTATGSVVIDQEQFDATAEEAVLDQAAERLELRRDAEIRGERFTLSGDWVEATFPGGSFDRVTSRGEARLIGEELQVSAPELRIFLEEDLIQRLIAFGPRGGKERSHARAKTFALEADSLDALLPGQRLRQVVAVGNARGEGVDTLAPKMPTPAPTDSAALAAKTLAGAMPEAGPPAGKPDAPAGDSVRARPVVSDRDWLEGDTIVAHFAAVDSAGGQSRAAADATDRDAELERLVATGDARSLYQMREESAAPGTRPGLNYLSGAKIDLTFRNGEVDVAQVEGLRQGLYLDPALPAAAPAGGEARPPATSSAQPTRE